MKENYPYQLSMSWGDNIMHDVLRLPSSLSVLEDFIKMLSGIICTTENSSISLLCKLKY